MGPRVSSPEWKTSGERAAVDRDCGHGRSAAREAAPSRRSAGGRKLSDWIRLTPQQLKLLASAPARVRAWPPLTTCRSEAHCLRWKSCWERVDSPLSCRHLQPRSWPRRFRGRCCLMSRRIYFRIYRRRLPCSPGPGLRTIDGLRRGVVCARTALGKDHKPQGWAVIVMPMVVLLALGCGCSAFA